MNQPINNNPEQKEQQGAKQNNEPEKDIKNEMKNSLPDQQEGTMDNGVLGANFEEEAKALNKDTDKKS